MKSIPALISSLTETGRTVSSFALNRISPLWTFLCLVPVAAVGIYQLVKAQLGWSFVGSLGIPNLVSYNSLLLTCAGAILSICLILAHARSQKLVLSLALLTTLLSTGAVWLQKDPNVEWHGSDVAINNYEAALIVLDEGPLAVIETWNARANPRVATNKLSDGAKMVSEMRQAGTLWLAGSRWDRLDLPQNNNRMYLHPPCYPLTLAAWMTVFGASRLSAQCFEIAVKLAMLAAAFLLAVRLIDSQDSLGRATLAALLATAPPIILFNIPHANELATLLVLIGLIVGTAEGAGFGRLFVAGVFLAAAAYTNLFYVVLAAVAALLLGVVATRQRRFAQFLGFVFGSGCVCLIFAALGYYPWLTYLTGSRLAYQFRLHNQVDTLSAILDYVYIGIPLLVLTGIGLLKFLSGRSQLARLSPWLVAGLAALALGVTQSFGLQASSRYLIGILFVLAPFPALAISTLRPSRLQALMIPMVNMLFVSLVLYL